MVRERESVNGDGLSIPADMGAGGPRFALRGAEKCGKIGKESEKA